MVVSSKHIGDGHFDASLYVVLPAAATLALGTLAYVNRGWIADTLYTFTIRSRGGDVPGKEFLEGNYAPVKEEVQSDELEVVLGSLPKALEGMYIRTGPNPMFQPVHGYHWFDGDGMLHGVRIKGGKASFCNRYVQTSKLQQEQAAGRSLFLKMGDMMGQVGLLALILNSLRKAYGIYDSSKGGGTANTALVYHAQRLLALHEGDLPYVVRILCKGVLDTIGRLQVDGHSKMTAHPKVDPETGEMFFIGYSCEAKPYISAGMVDASGTLRKSWTVETPYPVMMHDMALTANYVIILHLPLCFTPEVMVKENTLPFKYRKDLPARIGLLRRDAPSGPAQVQWFELPTFFSFHVANAYEEEDGEVKLALCCFQDFDLRMAMTSKLGAPSEDQRPRVWEYTLDPASGSATGRMLSEAVGDFPVVHPGKASHKARYTWIAHLDKSPLPAITGIHKIDMLAPDGVHDACMGSITYPPGCTGGEALFVPKKYPGFGMEGSRKAAQESEDDGWLLVYVFHEKEGVSKLHVYDAHTMSNTPVAVVRLPQRVPYGFHSTWVTEKQIAAQMTPALI